MMLACIDLGLTVFDTITALIGQANRRTDYITTTALSYSVVAQFKKDSIF